MPSLATVRSPEVIRTLGLASVARLPVVTFGALTLLQARHLGLSYALGGLTVGAFTLGFAAGSPRLGRLADMRGQAPVLHLTGVLCGLAITAMALVPSRLDDVLIPLAALAGVTQPPTNACVRAILARLRSGRDRDFLLTVDVSLHQIVFMLGPVTLLSLAVAAGPPAALAVAAVGLTLATSAFALGPEARAAPGARRPAHRGRGVIAHPRVLTIVAIGAALGVAWGAMEVAVVASNEADHGQIPLSILFLLWGCGSLVGGVVTTRRLHVWDRTRLIRALLLASAAFTALPVIPLPEWWLVPSLVLAGFVAAPLVALLYTTMSDTAPPHALTEAYAWAMTGMTGGEALGTAAAGIIATSIGVGAIFAVAACAVLAGAATWARRAATVNAYSPLEVVDDLVDRVTEAQ